MLRNKVVDGETLNGVRHMQTTDLQTGRLYVVLSLPSLIAHLTNLTEVASFANRSASLQSAFVAHRDLNKFDLKHAE